MRTVVAGLVVAALAQGCGGTEGFEDDDVAPDAASSHRLSIVFDYRYDTAGFFTPAARTTLEAAAAVWGNAFGDDFGDIPAGTSIRTRDPESPNAEAQSFPSDVAIDDVLIFVGCSNIDGPSGITATSNHAAALGTVTDNALRVSLTERYTGSNFEPWTAWISFDCAENWFFDQTPDTDDDIPGQTDFMSTAMHEIAHTLGFGTAEAFAALVNGSIQFAGPNAVAAFGGPVPLGDTAVHFQSGLSSDGREPLMDPSRPSGARFRPTTLDRAALTDLGYQPR